MKQRSKLQLMSMGVDLTHFEQSSDERMTTKQIKQAFADGIDASQRNAQQKLSHHDEDDDSVRMAAIVYDSDDDQANDRRWSSRLKWKENALAEFCANEQKTANPKPWKKIDPKYADEFVAKFCGYYPFESRPIGWRRVWHCNTAKHKAQDEWPGVRALRSYHSECH